MAKEHSEGETKLSGLPILTYILLASYDVLLANKISIEARDDWQRAMDTHTLPTKDANNIPREFLSPEDFQKYLLSLAIMYEF